MFNTDNRSTKTSGVIINFEYIWLVNGRWNTLYCLNLILYVSELDQGAIIFMTKPYVTTDSTTLPSHYLFFVTESSILDLDCSLDENFSEESMALKVINKINI